MASFVDKKNRTWELEFDGPTFEKINESTGLDISDESGKTLLQACASSVKLVKLCWLMVAEQAKVAGVTEDQFNKATNSGEVIEAMEEGLRKALADFTRPKLRGALLAVFQSQDRVRDAAIAEMKTTLEDPVNIQMAVRAVTNEMRTALENMKTQADESGLSANDSPATSDALLGTSA